jgi:glycosyltransferase involved in cell wall biosynthesis
MIGSVASTTLSNHQSAIELSVVVPIFNEYESLPRLVEALTQVLDSLRLAYEIICVDDGSTDGSSSQLRQLSQTTPALRAILLRRNYGQTAAMAAGFDYARGNIIVTMDGDLQNDPVDIPRLLDRLDEGFDLVSGWRKNRHDNPVTRLLPSKIANWLIARVTGVKLHDYGCSLKAYRGEVLHDMNLYGELHRFLPALAFIEGARITEIPVTHHPRRFGDSKYGFGPFATGRYGPFDGLFHEKISHPADAYFRYVRFSVNFVWGRHWYLPDPGQISSRSGHRRSSPANSGRCFIYFRDSTVQLWPAG